LSAATAGRGRLSTAAGRQYQARSDRDKHEIFDFGAMPFAPLQALVPDSRHK
jgi:hypothetical protein